MKTIRYNLISRVNTGTEEEPAWEENQGFIKTIPYSEASLEVAKGEAWQGEVEIVDDGEPETVPVPSLDERVNTLEQDSAETREALEMILSGVVE